MIDKRKTSEEAPHPDPVVQDLRRRVRRLTYELHTSAGGQLLAWAALGRVLARLAPPATVAAALQHELDRALSATTGDAPRWQTQLLEAAREALHPAP